MNKFLSTIKSLMVMLVVAGMMLSCSKAPEQANYIPKDANMVLAVDVKSIGLKSLDFKEILSISNFKKALSSKDSSIQKLKNSGIDLANTAYAFGNITSETESYGGLIVSLSDKAKFENFVKEIGSNVKISAEGDYSFASQDSEKNSIVAWNEKTAIFYAQTKEMSQSPKEKVTAIFNTKKEESLAQNDKNFAELIKKSADISFWANFEKLGKYAQSMNPTVNAIDFKETYLTATCNFEKGQVVINSKYHANKEISEKLNFGKDNLSKEIVSVVPGKSLIAALGMALDMGKLYNYLDSEKLIAGVDPQANAIAGMSAKELFEIFSGEIVATLNGAVMKEVKKFNYMTGEDEMKKEPVPEFAVIIGIANKEKSSKLLSALVEKNMIAKVDNHYSLMGGFYLIDKGSYIAIVPESMKQSAVDNSGEKLEASIADLLTKNSATMYLGTKNMKDELLDLYGPEAKEWVKTSPIESISLTGTAMKDQTSEGNCLISMKQKEENSLITLAKYSATLSEKVEKQYSYEPSARVEADSTAYSVPAEVDNED